MDCFGVLFHYSPFRSSSILLQTPFHRLKNQTKTTIDGLKRVCSETKGFGGEDRRVGEGVIYVLKNKLYDMEVFIKVNTLSNYKNVNDKELKVKEFLNSVVACHVPQHGFDENGIGIGDLITIDFSLKEVKSIRSVQ